MKILIISTVGLSYDGITSVILNNIQAMDRTGLEIHIAGTIRVDDNIRGQFSELGCKVVCFPDRKKETFRYFLQLIRYIRKNHIEVVHANGNSATLAIEMLAAWLGGCKRRIVHSHSTKCEQVRADKLLRPLFYRLYTDALACSKDAGIWLFGKHRYTVLKNGRNTELFRFDNETRLRMRRELGLEDEPVFAHVGGLVPSKNQNFLIKVFSEISQLLPSARFFIVGNGPLKQDLEQQAEQLGIKEKIIFTGNIGNVNEYLQAFDVAIMPSFYEGMPLVVIEWQLAGLQCLISDTITDECVMSDSVKFFDLNRSANEWAREAIKLSDKQDRIINSEHAVEEAQKKGYDIANCAACLKAVYLNERPNNIA